jgi:hypothetical protein
MSLPTDITVLDNLGSTTIDEWFRDHITENTFGTNPLVMRLLQLEKSQGGGVGKWVKLRGAGIKIREVITYAEIPSASYDDSSTFDTDEHEFISGLRFNWKGAYSPINFNAMKVAQNAGNDETQFFSLTESTAETAFNSLLDRMGYQFHGTIKQSDGTVITNPSILAKDWDGLYNALDKVGGTYGTYGGITRSATYGDVGFAINANVINAADAPLTKPLLQNGYSQCVFNKVHPDVGLCRRDLWNQLWERVEAQDRNTAGGPLREAGFETIKFNGAEVVPDDHAVPGTFKWLTAEAWHLWLLEGRDMVRRAKTYGFEGGFPLPTQDRTVDQLIINGNLVCSSPRLQCNIYGIKQG